MQRPGRILRIVSAALLIAALFPLSASAAENPLFRFQRAAYVLQRLYTGIQWPSVPISKRMPADDTANSLLKHPDARFVLVALARDLDDVAARKGIPPESAFYAAQTHDMLGNPAGAAEAMSRYVQTAPYRAGDHLFLVRTLYAAKRYEAAREAARRWSLRDGKCNETRLDFVWGSYRAEGLPDEAAKAVGADICQGWRGQVLLAKLRLDAEEEPQAEARVNALTRKNPADARAIRLFWNKLRAVEAYP